VTIYLDNAATTRLDEDVLQVMLPYFRERYGNPGSLHRLGAEAEAGLVRAREQVAQALNASPEEVVFTSGGTEANALAILGAARARKRRGDHVITSQVEHACVRQAMAALEAEGFRVTSLPGDELTPAGVAAAVTPKTVLVSLMHVNNETGQVFPISDIARAAKAASKKLAVHSDGVQAFGKLTPPGAEVDLYALSGHKVHGPKGTGALCVRRGTHLVPLVVGGGQERGLRGGTEGVPQLVGFGEAVARAAKGRGEAMVRVRELGRALRSGVEAAGGVINSPEGPAWVGSILNASFPGLAAEVLLHALEEAGVYTSTTSACASRRGKTSHVLEAMGLSEERLTSALRFSLSRETSAAEIAEASGAIEAATRALRAAPTGG
jgi:cysteine desulfurase